MRDHLRRALALTADRRGGAVAGGIAAAAIGIVSVVLALRSPLITGTATATPASAAGGWTSTSALARPVTTAAEPTR
uniref:hypothetical protein n=1 Tax=Lacticaseibacillus paracasei TaxID=1597 RepID=UPI001CDBDFD4